MPNTASCRPVSVLLSLLNERQNVRENAGDVEVCVGLLSAGQTRGPVVAQLTTGDITTG